MATKKVGDKVPDFGLPMYVVLLREGGYVVVSLGEIVKIVENNGRKYYYPEDFPDTPCFDKWGGRVDLYTELVGQFQGIAGMDDPYYFRSK
jgi:hypothetical protein